MSTNPFAKPNPPLTSIPGGSPAPVDDLDFNLKVPKLQLGLFDARCVLVKRGPTNHEHKLIIEFKLDEGPKGQKVSFWADPTDPDSMRKAVQVVAALGVEIVNVDGVYKPECGWRGLVGRPCRVAVDFYNSYRIPTFGKIGHDDCPPQYKNRDFGCGVLPPGSE